ncbi:MAG: triose-phosphate isomerase [Bacilli bacterium]|jgi:triosephosphate isomerase|nr:triose-phosphate isomerase [Bacilli bacterium]MDD3348940.1 triose-phosphate isomerase [Bacilli bacterium]MDD4056162.1 triose-phosphate isomerase [Bacilli bacterium]MDY0208790.1 triose-phosphate isomerase [Bacilli bacterium]
MRKPIIAGNWKMFKTRDETLQFVYAVSNRVPSVDKVDSIICAPFPVLRCLVKRQGENLRIGAQNMHFAEEGAYTGEVSAAMLTSIDVTYVIIGHSERRAMFNETDESVNAKLHQAFKHELKPILCVGETLKQREAEQTEKVIGKQIKKDLAGLTEAQVKELVIAYEPIWAIGTGKTATSQIADETCGFIRQTIKKLFNKETAEAIRIQYGGSVKLNNVDELMSMPNIDGALIGGASLVAEDFIKLVNAAVK